MLAASRPTARPELLDGQGEILRRMRLARNYNAWLLARARPYLGRRVLDVGAGTGTFTEAVAAEAHIVVAMEPDAAFAAGLRGRLADEERVQVLEGDASALTMDALGGPVDSVVCFNVLEHIRDDAQTVTRFREVLCPGGHLLLLVPAHPALYGATDRLVAHERRYRLRDVRRCLSDARLEIVDARYVNPLGALGWLVSSRVLKRALIPERSLKLYDRLVPVLRALDPLPVPFGLSVWAVARRPGAS